MRRAWHRPGPKPGAPTIPSVNITPFVIGKSPPIFVTFAAQTVTNGDTPRIPQDLTKFIAAATITAKILADPNEVLREALVGQTIKETTTFTVSTNPAVPEFGGGTSNIAFLEGNAAATAPNANAVSMHATFWIETVEHTLTVPVFKPGDPPFSIRASSKPGQNAPLFKVEPPHEIHEPKTITVTSTQIQYSQVVFLNFAGLTWPHVSVATLCPRRS